MENIKKLYEQKIITQMDIIYYLALKDTPNKTCKQLSFIYGFDYTQTTISLKRLIRAGLIEKTKEFPAQYLIK